MKKLNFFLSFCFILVSFLTIFSINSFASTNDEFSKYNSNIVTKNIDKNIETFALKEFPKHIRAIKRCPILYGFNENEIDYMNLSKPFKIYSNNANNEVIYCYPVLYKNEIKGIYEVMKISDNKYISTLEKGFSSELQNLLTNNKNKSFKIYNINGDIVAVNKFEAKVLYKDFNNKKDLSKKELQKLYDLNCNLDKNDLMINIDNYLIQPKSDPGLPTDYNYLDMNIVIQGRHDWCWAATCATIINYKKGTNLTASDVVSYVFGGTVNTGGNWDDMKKAYNNWSLYPEQWDVALSYSQVKDFIDNDQPIHMRTRNSKNKGHSMILRGYEKYIDSNSIYSLIDPNKSYYVSVTGNDSGSNVYYILNGTKFYWQRSIVGFFNY